MVDFSDWKRKLYAVLAVLLIFTIVLYPLWPLKMRQGVYYLSWGFLILLGLFFLMAIFRVILFCVTYFVTPPGLWLFPNLWEDVSFLDSFKPVWAWHEVRVPRAAYFVCRPFRAARLTVNDRPPRKRRRSRLETVVRLQHKQLSRQLRGRQRQPQQLPQQRRHR
jgi:protein translocation Sec62 family protein